MADAERSTNIESLNSYFEEADRLGSRISEEKLACDSLAAALRERENNVHDLTQEQSRRYDESYDLLVRSFGDGDLVGDDLIAYTKRFATLYLGKQKQEEIDEQVKFGEQLALGTTVCFLNRADRPVICTVATDEPKPVLLTQRGYIDKNIPTLGWETMATTNQASEAAEVEEPVTLFLSPDNCVVGRTKIIDHLGHILAEVMVDRGYSLDGLDTVKANYALRAVQSLGETDNSELNELRDKITTEVAYRLQEGGYDYDYAADRTRDMQLLHDQAPDKLQELYDKRALAASSDASDRSINDIWNFLSSYLDATNPGYEKSEMRSQRGPLMAGALADMIEHGRQLEEAKIYGGENPS